MKHGALFTLAAIAIVLAVSAFTVPSNAIAAPDTTPEPTPEATPIVVYIAMEPTPEPPAAATQEPKQITITEHDIPAADIETIARLLWMSPLRNKTAKAALAWVVMNRVSSSDFPDTIAENVTLQEFAFYDKRAHLSDENMELARLVINQWMSENDGNHAGRPIPKTALFIRFTGDKNRTLEVMKERGGSAITYPIDWAYNYEE